MKFAAVLFAFCLCFVAVTLATDNLQERTGAAVVPATVVGSTANVATVPTTQKVVTVSTSSASSLSPFYFAW